MSEVIITPTVLEGPLPLDLDEPALEGMYRAHVDVTTPNGVTTTVWAVAETPGSTRAHLRRRVGAHLVFYWNLMPVGGCPTKWEVVDLMTGEPLLASEALYHEFAGACRQGYRGKSAPASWAIHWALDETGGLLLVNKENERHAMAPANLYAVKWENLK